MRRSLLASVATSALAAAMLAQSEEAWAQATAPFGLSQHISSSLTRAANTTTYTADTGWCTTTTSCTGVFSWAVCSASGSGRFLITGVHVQDSANQTTTRLTGILWLFTASPSAVFGDDVAFAITNSTDIGNLLMENGFAFSEAGATGQTSTTFAGADLAGTTYGPFQCGSSTSTIYGMVEVTNAYVPVSGEKLTIWLDVVFIQ